VTRSEDSPEPIRILFSAAWPGALEIDALPDPGMEVDLVRRTIDWQMTGVRRLATYVLDSLRIVRQGLAHDVTIVSTAGLETFVVALLWPLVRRRRGRRHDLVILDPIPLRWRRIDRVLAIAMRNVAMVVCIRRGDIETFERRFAVPSSRCRFVPMPVPTLADDGADAPGPGRRDEYVYAAGSAHRDWPILLRAFEQIPDYRCVLATRLTVQAAIPPNVELLPELSPEEGRALMRRAVAVAVTFEDTDLACGPTILLDAYAMGLPVACTNTNACRDYVRDGVTGYLSPPGDATALAHNIRFLFEDTDGRQAMRQSIKALVQGDLSREAFLNRITTLIHELGRP